MGFLAGEDDAVMWRGLMLNRAVQHFLEEVDWGDLDYLVVDMPPGTGDVQMGLARMLPSAEVLIVTTPAHAAQKVAARAASMARKSYLRIAGVIENMSAFTCSHGERHELFGSGGGQRLAERDRRPPARQHPPRAGCRAWWGQGRACRPGPGQRDSRESSPASYAVVVQACPVVEMTGCSARLLEALRRRRYRRLPHTDTPVWVPTPAG